MEKFEIEVKWGSYLFIVNTATSILIVLLMFLIDIQSLLYLSNVLIPVFIVQLLYFSVKAIKEKNEKNVFQNLFIFFRIFVFCFSLITLLVVFKEKADSSITTTCIRKESSELLEDDSDEYEGITLNEFIVFLKRKLVRA